MVDELAVFPELVSSNQYHPFDAAVSLCDKVQDEERVLLSAAELTRVQKAFKKNYIHYPKDTLLYKPLLTRSCVVMYAHPCDAGAELRAAVVDSDDPSINPAISGRFGLFTDVRTRTSDVFYQAIRFAKDNDSQCVLLSCSGGKSRFTPADDVTQTIEQLLLRNDSYALDTRELVERRKEALLERFDVSSESCTQALLYEFKRYCKSFELRSKIILPKRKAEFVNFPDLCRRYLEQFGIDVPSQLIIDNTDSFSSFLESTLAAQRKKLASVFSFTCFDYEFSSLSYGQNSCSSTMNCLFSSPNNVFVFPVIMGPYSQDIKPSIPSQQSLSIIENHLQHSGILISPHVFALNGQSSDADFVTPLSRFDGATKDENTDTYVFYGVRRNKPKQ